MAAGSLRRSRAASAAALCGGSCGRRRPWKPATVSSLETYGRQRPQTMRTVVVCGKFDTSNRSGSVAGAVADDGGVDTGRRLVCPSAGHGWPTAPSIFSSTLPAWSR
jgi:hypothetical protein